VIYVLDMFKEGYCTALTGQYKQNVDLNNSECRGNDLFQGFQTTKIKTESISIGMMPSSHRKNQTTAIE